MLRRYCNANTSSILICIALLYFACPAPACSTKKPTPVDNLNTQAEEMSAAFLKEDFIRVANYTSPLVFELTGGKENLIKGLTQSVSGMKAQGMNFHAISFDKPSEAINYNGQLQATIAQQTEIRRGADRMISTSILIALSEDDGKNWKFIDTSGKDTATIRKAFPYLSPVLNIPEAKAPVSGTN